MGFWKEQRIAIDDAKCMIADIEEKGSNDTMKEYTKEWENLYYLIKNNLRELGVKK